MLPENITAGMIVTFLLIFFLVNLSNLAKAHPGKKKANVYAEIERPKDFVVGLAAFGTLVFFLESLAYPFLVFTGLTSMTDASPFQLRFHYDSYAQIVGIILTLTGYSLFVWSTVARGRYAVSWEMPEDHKLVTWGPYRYVRHPSYLAYFLMFFGLLFTWLNLATLVPFIAIPGYIRITTEEEKLLKQRFGDEYVKYQMATGRFLPKRRRAKNS